MGVWKCWKVVFMYKHNNIIEFEQANIWTFNLN